MQAIPEIGEEVFGADLADAYADKLDVMLTHRGVNGLTVAQVRERASPSDARGVFIAAVTRLDSTIPALPGTELHRGDVLTSSARGRTSRGARRSSATWCARRRKPTSCSSGSACSWASRSGGSARGSAAST